jgi:hypothetical protein
MSRKHRATDLHAHSTNPQRTSPWPHAGTRDGDASTRRRAVAERRILGQRHDTDVSTVNQPPIRRSDGQVYGG